MTTQTIPQWLAQLVPMSQISQIVGQVLPAFILLAVFILCTGLVIQLAGPKENLAPYGRFIVVLVCMSASPWFLSLAQGMVNGIVGAIAAADPALNWLVVQNPQPGSLALDFSKPFQLIGQYFTGNTQNQSAPTGLDSLNPVLAGTYFAHIWLVGITGVVAAITVFVMEAMLILQALILQFSRLLIPVFIACLSLKSANGSAHYYLKSVLGVMAWPIGWCFVHIGTMAALQNLVAPNWNQPPGALVLAFISLSVLCLWMVAGTLGAPFLIAKAVSSGSNLAAGVMGEVSSAIGQHSGNAIRGGATVAGGVVGAATGAPNTALGASAGAFAGKVARYLWTRRMAAAAQPHHQYHAMLPT